MKKYSYKNRAWNPWRNLKSAVLGISRMLEGVHDYREKMLNKLEKVVLFEGKLKFAKKRETQAPKMSVDFPSFRKIFAASGNFIIKGAGRLKNIKNRELPMPISRKFMEFMSFKKIFLTWVTFVIAFGLFYFLLDATSPENGLIGFNSASFTRSVLDSLYFSFITATSTGFGDITPVGLSKIVSVIEIIGSMVIFGIVVSKLVSFKQEVILDEIYEISLDEKVNRLRSALYLSRSDIGRINERISEGRVPKTMIDHMWSAMNSMNDTMLDMQKVICPMQGTKKDFIKKVGNFQIELALNSITLSLGKMNELLISLNSVPHNWRSAKNIQSIRSVLSVVDSVCGYYSLGNAPHGLMKRMEEVKSVKKEIEKRM